MKTHVGPILGSMVITAPLAIAVTQIETLVAMLDQKIHSEEMSWHTASNAWSLVTKLFDDACNSKNPALRKRSDNPCLGVRGPDRGTRKAKVFLYPDEAEKLLRSDRVPLEAREVYAVAIYTFMRVGELKCVAGTDVDVVHGNIHVHRAVDRDTGDEHETKGKENRRFNLEPAVVPLLKKLVGLAGARRLFPSLPADDNDLSDTLRKHLKLAGVDRAELFISDRTRKNITFHDLRATGITWMAVRGDAAQRIQQRAGHKDFNTTQHYIREADAIGESFGGPFPPLSSLGEKSGIGLAEVPASSQATETAHES
jgi:integrase